MPNARALVSLLPLLLACTGSTSGAAGAGDGGMNTNDAKVHMGHDAAVDAVTPLSDAAVDVAEGDVSGDWCGQVMVSGTVTIPTGQSLTICAGSDVRFANDAKLRVDGTLTLDGSASAPIKLGLDSTWGGIRVAGTLSGSHFELKNGATGIQGVDGSSIELDHGSIEDCALPVTVSNGASFDHVTIRRGTSVNVTGGTLTMVDSLVDFERVATSPDCLVFSNGGAHLEHVRVTGCHCPLHFNSASGTVSVTDSIFDGAAIPMMIANATGTFTHNHFLPNGNGADIQDIGGNLSLNIAENYYGGGAPDLLTGNANQFAGRNNYLADPVVGVGPR